MNAKTTVILLALLVALGGYLFFTRDTGNEPKKQEVHKLVEIDQLTDVSKIVITPSDGKPIVLDKASKDWRLAQPVNAAADTTEVNRLIESLIALKSTAQVDTKSTNPRTGLDKPQFTVEVTVKGKPLKISIGEKMAVGNGAYAKIDGKDTVEVVAADILDRLDKPASAYRQLKLVETPSTDIKQLVITRKDGSVRLEKDEMDWRIVEPIKVPADAAAVTDLLGSLTGLRAASFVDDPADASAMPGASPAVTSISFSTRAPSTQASTQSATAPAMTTITFSGFDDRMKQNVFTRLSGSPFVAKVSTSTVETFNKNAADLRDKKVLDVDPVEVSRFSIATDIVAATQPTSRPAKKETLAIERRKQGPDRSRPPYLPTTGPSTEPALKFNWPGPKGATWLFASGGDADDAEVTNFLSVLHPLRADKFLDTNPATQPSGTYIVTLHTEAAGGAKVADVEIRVLDRGGDLPFVGQYNGLTFEVSRNTIGRFLEGDFKKKPGGGMPSGMPSGMPGGMPGGFPGGFGQ